jgi:hypothetical protein
MLDYNIGHTDKPLMPYIILKTTKNNSESTDNRLPYSKDNGAQKGTMEFVNVPLDTAYAKGELDKIVEKEGWKPVVDSKTNEVIYTAV